MFQTLLVLCVVLCCSMWTNAASQSCSVTKASGTALNSFNPFFHDFALFPSRDFLWPVERDLTSDLVPIMGTDLIESTDSYDVHVDLPGVDVKDLDVSLNEKMLVISAERKHMHHESTDKIHSMERSFGKVQRRIRLPNNADLDKVDTNFKNGVLSIHFPKKQDSDTSVRKLTINTSTA